MKRHISIWVLFLLLANVFVSCEKEELKTITFKIEKFPPVSVEKSHDQMVFMHYMPWFETKESNNNSWGIHWTMANQNPDIIDGDGRRQIASHYYPMIGAYHSGDKNVIEYHLLLMKYAGIDGVLIDWYGSFDLNDSKINRENTEALIELIDKVGLKFAIVYEDRFLDQIVDAGLAGSEENAAKVDMQYLQSNYFNHPNYHYVDDKPLMLVFGPERLKTDEAWNNVFSVLNPNPAFLTYSGGTSLDKSIAQGEFAWVFDGDETKEDAYYENVDAFEIPMGSAYPGFHDFYKEGGWGDNFFFLDHNNGATLDSKLQKVKNANVDLVQLVTWNDFGEGTILEPTREFGFSYVEKIREFNEVSSASNAVFQNILDLYNMRIESPNDIKRQKHLDQAFYYFVSMQTEKALEELYQE
jgi:hypothetical protein